MPSACEQSEQTMKIKTYGDNALRNLAAPVAVIDDKLRAVLDVMVELMDTETGAGLAAPQVGISSRFLVMREAPDGETIKMINPVIISKSETICTMEEGCLSLLGPDDRPVYADISRPESVTVQWTDERGKEHSREFSGFPARVIQHELDHLDGILFIDHVSSAKREMMLNKIKKRKQCA